MLTFQDILRNKKSSLSFLILIAIISRFPFVLNGFGETDSANLAVSIIDFITYGNKGFLTELYFLDVVPLYVAYIKFVLRLLDNNYSYLPAVMNYTNAVFGTLIVVPSYLLVSRLFNNNIIAFCTSLTFSFVPSIYQSSIYGFPHLIALFFFILSLYFFLTWIDNLRSVWFISSIVALTVAILFKSDIILGSGAYFGLLYIKRRLGKENILLFILVITLSLVSFFLLRRMILGESNGSTTSLSGFTEWFMHFVAPVLSKSISQLIRDQAGPIAYGSGILNFIMATLVIFFYLKHRSIHIIVFIFSWSALPTFLWLILWINSARHNMLSVLPFIVIIFLYIHEKAPRLILLFPVLLTLGNLLVTTPSASTRIPSGSIFQSQSMLDDQANNLHLVAKNIVGLNNNKLVFTTESFRPYLYYEIFSATPRYELTKLDNSCYGIENTSGELRVCIFTGTELILAVNEIITKYRLEKHAIVLPLSTDIDVGDLKEMNYTFYGYERYKFIGKL
ncbi:MAG: hypothetical protein C4581_07270 [Nitrospiraceae bacterium]|nr:MAG: hypothetical protein C4581_07270 [Nitrospiraceae bacterium]